MVPLNKQDAQNMLENTKNRIIEKVATRQDVVLQTEASRDRVMNYVRDLLQVFQQNLLRRQEYQQSQTQRRMVAMETRMINLEQEIKANRLVLQQILDRLSEQQSQQRITLPADVEAPVGYGQYAYKQE